MLRLLTNAFSVLPRTRLTGVKVAGADEVDGTGTNPWGICGWGGTEMDGTW
jgi:hypothetical protein